jgi:hypothetical protein
MGTAMDADYHLAAYSVTGDGVAPGSVLEPMRLMQSDGLKFPVPLLPPFLFGGWVSAATVHQLQKGVTGPGIP